MSQRLTSLLVALAVTASVHAVGETIGAPSSADRIPDLKAVLVLSAEDLTRPWVQQFIEGVREAVFGWKKKRDEVTK